VIGLLSELRVRFRALFHRRAVEAELEEELRFHLERQAEAYALAGVPPDEAVRRARLRFGGVDGVKEECREARGVSLFETILQDLRYGLRLLAKSPALTIAAILTLTLGIGANSAILSAVHRALLRPLPYPEPERLVVLYGTSALGGRAPFSVPTFLDVQAQGRAFEAMATFDAAGLVVAGDGPPELVRAGRVSPDFFRVLGKRAALGRTFLPEEGRAGRERVLVLGDGIWRRRFGGDRGIVGRTVVFNTVPYTVIGVLPADFEFAIPGVFKPAEAWVPNVLVSDESQRNHNSLKVIARRRRGVSERRAQADLDAVGRRLARAHPATMAGARFGLERLSERVVGEIRPLLLILLGAVVLLFGIACANVASLQLARASTRQKEIALRLALGASRRRVVQQLLTESLLLAVAGGGLGLVLAVALNGGSRLLGGLVPEGLLGSGGHGLDPGSLAGTLVLSLGSGVLFGLAPALQAARFRGGRARSEVSGLGEALKEGSRSAAEGRRGGRLREVLLVGEVALALVLLAGAGLLVRSFLRVLAERRGFDVDPVLTQTLRLPRFSYPDAGAQTAFYRRVLERAGALPGVVAVGGIDDLPLTPDRDSESFAIEGGEPLQPDRSQDAQTRSVTPGYFAAMGTPVLRGRAFTAADSSSAPPVVLINRTLARRFFGDPEVVDPVGRRLTFASGASSPSWRTIVGVVGDVRDLGLATPPDLEIYLPFEQAPVSYMNLVARTAGEPVRLAGAVHEAISTLDKGLPLAPAAPMRTVLAASIAQRRFSMLLMALFAVVALLLAAVGIYGVLAYSAARRAHEIGVRMALGARRAQVFQLVIGRSLALTALGVGAGVAGALVSTRLLAGLLYGVPPTDPLTLTGVALLLFAVAALASYLPARRATEVAPVVALRGE
jgi:putative ABC transport system permease protein